MWSELDFERLEKEVHYPVVFANEKEKKEIIEFAFHSLWLKDKPWRAVNVRKWLRDRCFKPLPTKEEIQSILSQNETYQSLVE